MSPKGMAAVSNAKTFTHNSPGFSELLSVRPKRKMRWNSEQRKRRSTDSLNVPAVPNKKGKPSFVNPDAEVVSVQSDSPVSNTTEQTDDDVILVAEKHEEIIVSDDSDDESVEIEEAEYEVIDVCDSETESANIVINTDQAVSIDNIINSALQSPSETRTDPAAKIETPSTSNKGSSERLHWKSANGFPKSWTKKMIRYYTKPNDKNRNFDYVQILKNLKTKPADWWISHADRMGPSRSRRSFNQCRKCDKFGHNEKECTKVFVCYICGEHSHMYPNCPHAFCFTCGRPTEKSTPNCRDCMRVFHEKKVCGLCGQFYHEEVTCPSKWRKYAVLNPTTEPMKLNSRKFCYNCAKEGHFGFQCTMGPDSEYPPENPLVTSPYSQSLHSAESDSNNVIFVSRNTANFLSSQEGDDFIRCMCEELHARIDFCHGVKDYLKIVGHESKANILKGRLEMVLKSSNVSRVT